MFKNLNVIHMFIGLMPPHTGSIIHRNILNNSWTLAQNIPYYVVINEFLDLRIQVKFKEPSQTTLKSLSKIKSIGVSYIKEYIAHL